MRHFFRKARGSQETLSNQSEMSEADSHLLSQGWPANFDFESDPICQDVFKPFIDEQLRHLRNYDSQRKHLSDYKFHIHAVEAAMDVKKTCIKLDLGKKVANNLYYATLIHDLGKPELDPEIWDHPDSPPDDVKVQKRQHVHTGVSVFRDFLNGIPDNDMRNKARNHPFAALALDVIQNHHERLDGKGENKLSAEQISMPVRLVCIVEDYDGNSHLRPHHVAAGLSNDPPAIFERMETKRAGWFDEDLLEAFRDIKMEQYHKKLSMDHSHHSHHTFNLEN